MSTKQDQLKAILQLLGSSVTKGEFTDAFKQVIQIVKDIKTTNTQEWQALHSAFNVLKDRVTADFAPDMAEMKQKTIELCKAEMATMMAKHDKKMAAVDARMAKVKDGAPGLPGNKGDPGQPPTKAELVSLIKPLLPTVDEIVKKIPEPVRVQTPAKSYQIRTKDCTSQCDGANKTFTVGGTHFGIIGLYGTQFPLIYRPVIDYTETKTGFLLTDAVAAPDTGQTLVAQFLK